tara:strand:- start:1256 stop:2917 length:1662 start_codon:yes stop_codon:yes gene_type:complete
VSRFLDRFFDKRRTVMKVSEQDDNTAVLTFRRDIDSYIGVLLTDLGFVVISLMIALSSTAADRNLSEVPTVPDWAFAGFVMLSATIMVAFGLPRSGASDADGRIILRTAVTTVSLALMAIMTGALSGLTLPLAVPMIFSACLFIMMTVSRAIFARLNSRQLPGRRPTTDPVDKMPTADVFLGRTETGEDTLDGLYGLDTYVGKSVLVSGAGGSIGSELCRQLIHLRPGRLILFDLSEVALFDVHRTLLQTASAAQVELVPVLGSVTDGMLVAQVLAQQSVDIVLHAAAYKHVSLVQRNPLAGLSNNALGTHVLTTAAVQAGVERFILVSSDKAMRPSGVMGVSKRLAELIVQDIAHRMGDDGPILSIVRFGNVLGSSGSVVPIFQDQIRRGGPVTVTDPHATRYFMTVSEAGRLVLHAGAMSRGGEIFVLDMGKPVRILDLALQAIVAAGRTIRSPKVPYGEIAVEIVGLGEGENRHEQALCDGTEKATAHHRIFCLEDAGLSEFEVAEILRALRNAIASGQPEEAFSALARRIPGFRNPTDPEETLPIAHIS